VGPLAGAMLASLVWGLLKMLEEPKSNPVQTGGDVKLQNSDPMHTTTTSDVEVGTGNA